MDHLQHPHAAHAPAPPADPHPGRRADLNRVALLATAHCLAGCAVGEVLGMVIGVAAQLPKGQTVLLAVALAFVFGYAFTFFSLLRSGMAARAAVGVTLAADTASIALMEIVDNGLMLLIPGAMDAGLSTPLFWGALALALLTAGVAAYPLNRWLIARGKGHALAHAGHAH